MVPASVDGGANKSGFIRSSAVFDGPRSEAPRFPRSGSGVMSVSWLQRGWFGSSLAKGTTSVPAGPDAVKDSVGAAAIIAAENAREMYKREAERATIVNS